MATKTNLKMSPAVSVFLLAVAILSVNAFATGNYDGGYGSPGNPFQINTAVQMDEIGQHSEDWGLCFILTADINLSGYTGTAFHIIGYYIDSNKKPFAGVFDGNSHTISNFTYATTDTDYIGIFGYVDQNAEIKDLTLTDANVTAGGNSDCVGSLVGWLRYGTIIGCDAEGGSVSGDYYTGGLVGKNDGLISNCYATGAVSGDYYVGGLVGRNGFDSTISDCYATGTVTGGYLVGGLLGYNYYGTVLNCYATGTVTGDYVGGLLGHNYYGTVLNCYATGTVTGDHFVGGLVGQNYNGTISDCYATGRVSGYDFTGGLVGYNNYGTISNCYATGPVSGGGGGLVGCNWYGSTISASFWDIETSGKSSSAGGEGKTTAEMQTLSTFAFAGWDFVDESDNGIEDIWRLCNEGAEYPQLSWQYLLGDFVCPDGVDWSDVAVLCEQWLQVGAYSADIAPPPAGDGIVNFLDFAALADN